MSCLSWISISMLPTNFLLSGLTSMKLEKRIQKMCTFTYLRLFTFMLWSIQYKIVATMRKAKVAPTPRILEILEIKFLTFKDIPKVLKNFKFLHLKVDEIVGVPVPTLFGIKCKVFPRPFTYGGIYPIWGDRVQGDKALMRDS